jgi:ribosomal protein S18 acetylase RimI-like enzyme
MERLHVRGAWPERVEITAGWAKATVRPWNDDVDAASIRLERGGARFLASSARLAAEWSPDVLSPATLPSAKTIWRQAGFVETDRLLLMEHNLTSVERPTAVIIAGGVEPAEDLSRIDSEAFAPRWRLGRLGLAESVAATNRSIVFRVAAGDTCVGFAIVGVALGAGYLQRLAVSPTARGQGLGSDLVRASLRWARGHGARSMLVNTQTDNVAAASIYRRLGFNDVPGGLLLFQYAPSQREG